MATTQTQAVTSYNVYYVKYKKELAELIQASRSKLFPHFYPSGISPNQPRLAGPHGLEPRKHSDPANQNQTETTAEQTLIEALRVTVSGQKVSGRPPAPLPGMG